MQLLNTDRCRARVPLLTELESEAVSPFRVVIDRVQSPLNVLSCALSDDGRTVIGYFSMAIVPEEFLRMLADGVVGESDTTPWTGERNPVLFIRDLVIHDRHVAPRLFRQGLKDLHELCQTHDIYLHKAFTVAHHWTVKRILLRYQFREAGQTREGRPILSIDRESSPIFNSFLKTY
jgi:hypothetical protein